MISSLEIIRTLMLVVDQSHEKSHQQLYPDTCRSGVARMILAPAINQDVHALPASLVKRSFIEVMSS